CTACSGGTDPRGAPRARADPSSPRAPRRSHRALRRSARPRRQAVDRNDLFHPSLWADANTLTRRRKATAERAEHAETLDAAPRSGGAGTCKRRRTTLGVMYGVVRRCLLVPTTRPAFAGRPRRANAIRASLSACVILALR